jgi:hypothetical protein
MHFEHLILSKLQGARTTSAWSASLQSEIASVTGDDAAMSMMGVGASLKEFQSLFAPRVTELEQQFIEPLDEVNDAVVQAERELDVLRQRQRATTTAIWSRYKADYERYLQPPDDAAEVEAVDETTAPAGPSNGSTTGDDEAGAADSQPDGRNSEETP